MDLKKIITSTSLSLVAVSAFADSYQSEIHLNLTTTSEKPFDNENGGSLSGTIFFKPVELKDHPLAEAAFLEKSNNFQLSYGYEKGGNKGAFNGYYYENGSDVATPYGGNSDTKLTNAFTKAKLEYYVPDTMFYLGGAVDKFTYTSRTLKTITSPSPWQGFTSRDEYSDSGTIVTASIGIAPIDGLLVWSDYSTSEHDDAWSLNSKYVFSVKDHAINLEAGYMQTKNSADRYRIAADYYIDRSFSIGAMYYSSAYDLWGDIGEKYVNDHMTDLSFNSRAETYGLRAKKFFNDNFALEASVTTTESNASNTFNIGISKRF